MKNHLILIAFLFYLSSSFSCSKINATKTKEAQEDSAKIANWRFMYKTIRKRSALDSLSFARFITECDDRRDIPRYLIAKYSDIFERLPKALYQHKDFYFHGGAFLSTSLEGVYYMDIVCGNREYGYGIIATCDTAKILDIQVFKGSGCKDCPKDIPLVEHCYVVEDTLKLLYTYPHYTTSKPIISKEDYVKWDYWLIDKKGKFKFLKTENLR